MTRFRTLACGAWLAAAGLAAACAPISVTSYSASRTDWARYRTYAWDQVRPEVPREPRLDANPFFHEYLRAAVDRELMAKGLEPQRTQPDLLVHYHARVTQRVYDNEIEPVAGRCDGCAVQVWDEGTLIVDLVDPLAKAVVWRGSAETGLPASINDQRRMEQAIDRAVAKIVATLPRK
jgi:hypothetical protein